MSSIVKIEHVTKKMKSLVALDDISLEISESGIYGFVGPNGSGKSLIFKTILGFLKPDSGQVFVHGKKLRKDVLFAEDTGYSMVEYAALADKTGRQNLELMDILASEKHDLDKLLRYVGLDPNNQRTYKEYSLGMKQRLLLAMAMLSDPSLLIFDEPTNALDEDGQEFLKRLVLEQRKRGKTLLISSHDKTFITDVADKIYYVSEGRIKKEAVNCDEKIDE